MATNRIDPFRIWSEAALFGVRAYAATMATGMEAASRLMPQAGPFPTPAIRRASQLEMWPAAGSFGSNNAVGAWVDATQAMMGVAPRRTGVSLAFPWGSMPALMPMPWSGLAGVPGMSMTMPWALTTGWPMPGVRLAFAPFAAPASLADPFRLMRLMSPMLDAMTPAAARSLRYH